MFFRTFYEREHKNEAWSETKRLVHITKKRIDARMLKIKWFNTTATFLDYLPNDLNEAKLNRFSVRLPWPVLPLLAFWIAVKVCAIESTDVSRTKPPVIIQERSTWTFGAKCGG